MNEFKQHTNWLQLAAIRIKTYYFFKVLGITAYMAIFMLVYFWLLKHPMFPVTVMPMTSLDRLISFQPWCIVPYASLWLYISLVPLLFCTWHELAPYLSAVTLLSLVGFTIFIFWPTTVHTPDINWRNFPSVAFLKSLDTSGNACPSLHVAFAILSGLWLNQLFKQMGAPVVLRVVNVCWCGLIGYSTLAIKQHVALDLEAGAALGLCVTMVFLYILPSLHTMRRMPVSG